jgi:hypothetical protein
VRANFASVAGVTHGVYSSLQDFDRSIPAPTGLTTEAGSKAVVFSWDSRPGAKQYKVQVSRSTSFGTLISGGSVTTDNTSYAPSLDGTDYLNGGTFFWRVAEVDNDGNQGQWSGAQSVSQAAKIAITASLPYLKKGVYNSLTVTIKDFAGHVVPGATVTVKGAGISLITKTTGSTGKATFRVKPTKKANVTLTASKAGYITISKLLPRHRSLRRPAPPGAGRHQPVDRRPVSAAVTPRAMKTTPVNLARQRASRGLDSSRSRAAAAATA